MRQRLRYGQPGALALRAIFRCQVVAQIVLGVVNPREIGVAEVVCSGKVLQASCGIRLLKAVDAYHSCKQCP